MTAFVLAGAGCAATRLAVTTGSYQGRILPTRDAGPGEERLKMEVDVDPTLRAYLRQNGSPDYIHVVDVNHVELLYLDADRSVIFSRRMLRVQDDVNVTYGIPEPPVASMDAEERQRFLDRLSAHRELHGQ